MAAMNFEDDVYSQSLRVKYAKMLKVKDYLNEQKARIDIQMLENDISLIEVKSKLYGGWFYAIDFNSHCRTVSKWLDDVRSGKVKRNAKCDGKERCKFLCGTITDLTGIEVKELTNIIFFGYSGYRLELEFKPLMNPKITCRLTIPNFKSGHYCASITEDDLSLDQKKKNYSEILYDLDTELSVITKQTDWSTELETVAKFPNGTPLAEFNDALKQWCLNREKE